MTMVNTFMKTQHQHVMPQRKERETLKANTWADPGRRWRARSPPALARGDRAQGRPAFPTAQHTPPRPCFSQCRPHPTKTAPQPWEKKT